MRKYLLLIVLLFLLGYGAGATCTLPAIFGARYWLYVTDTLTLFSDSTGGVWRSSDTNIIKINPATGLAKCKQNGDAIITYTYTGACGIGTTAVTLTVSKEIFGKLASNNINWLVSSEANIGFPNRGYFQLKRCINDSVALAVSDSLTPYSGTWSSSNTSIATVNSTTGMLYTRGSIGYTIITYSFLYHGETYRAVDTFRTISTPSIPYFTDTVCGGSPGGFTFRFYNRSSPIMIKSLDTSFFINMGGMIRPFYTYIHYDNAIELRAHDDSVNVRSTLLYTTSLYCNYVHDSARLVIKPSPSVPPLFAISATDLCLTDSPLVHHIATVTAPTVPSGTRILWTSYPTYSYSYSYIPRLDSGMIDSSGRVYFDFPARYNIHCTSINSYGCPSSSSFYREVIARSLTSTPLNILGLDTIALGSIATYNMDDSAGHTFDSIRVENIAGNGVMEDYNSVRATSPGMINVAINATNACGTRTITKPVFIRATSTSAASSHFSGFLLDSCSGPRLYNAVLPHTAAYSLKTYYGDGTNSVNSLSARTDTQIIHFNHYYPYSGDYTIKQVLLSGSSAIDSISYPYTFSLCRAINVGLYYDANGNCLHDTDAVEQLSRVPLTVGVDSAGIRVDTLHTYSGFHYEAYGAPGTVYTFRLLTSGFTAGCGSTGVFSDTVSAGFGTRTLKEVPLRCSTGTFDFRVHSSTTTGRHAQLFTIMVDNISCPLINARLRLSHNPRYIFQSSSVSPASVTSGNIEWNLSSVSTVARGTTVINVYLDNFDISTWLRPGDLARSIITIVPSSSGESDTTNNVEDRNDTVRSSWDPNYMSSKPEGNILNGTRLTYSVIFENDGNDTARNIHVMDTLSDDLDPSSLQILSASKPMYVSEYRRGGHSILKFDFPHIMLPDSTHHGQNRATFSYSIKARRGLPDGRIIMGRAGIYFDDNEVVMTPEAYNTIVVPTNAISIAGGTTRCLTDTLTFTAAPHTVPNTHYQWYVNSTTVGTDTTVFRTAALRNSDVVKCKLMAQMDDTATAMSNSLTLSMAPYPHVSPISGGSLVCDSVHLTDTATAGTWRVRTGRASIDAAGMARRISNGLDTIIYRWSNYCGADSALLPVTVNVHPNAGSIAGATHTCDSTPITLTTTGSGGAWSVAAGRATITSGGVLRATTTGSETVRYIVSNVCGTDTATRSLSLINSPTAGTITGATRTCDTNGTVLTASVAGGTWSVAAGSGSITTAGRYTGSTPRTDTVRYTVTNICGSDAAYHAIEVFALQTASISISSSPRDSVCAGRSVVYTPTIAHGGSRPTYEWRRFSTVIDTTATLTYIPAAGDIINCTLTSDEYCLRANPVNSNSISVTVLPSETPTVDVISIPADSISYAGQLVTYYATITFGGSVVNYQWYLNGSPVAGATSSSYSRRIYHNDTVWCTTHSDYICATTADVSSRKLPIAADYLGINNTAVASAGFKLYPNPNNGDFVLENTLSRGGEYELGITSVTGQAVYHATVSGNASTHQLKLNHLSEGVYWLTITGAGTQDRLRFTIVK